MLIQPSRMNAVEFAQRRFDAVVFDMDGLLLDSERPMRDFWVSVSAQLGTPLTAADYLLTVGRNRRDSLVIVAELLQSTEAAQRLDEAVEAELAAHLARQPFELKPGALDLLRTLQAQGVPCAVASSTRHAEVLRRLDAAGIRPFFGPVHGGDQVSRGKPDPELFQLAARSLGVDPSQALVFEDSGLGAQGALAAGMSVIIVPDLKQPDPSLLTHCLQLESLHQALPHCPTWFGKT